MQIISRFHVEALNSYLNIDISFNNGLTIMYGMNGSGKTSVLKLISNIINGDIEELVHTSFSYALLMLRTIDEGAVQIIVEKERSGVIYKIVSANGKRVWPENESRNDESVDDQARDFCKSSVLKFLKELPPFIFLDINRNYREFAEEDQYHHNREKFLLRHAFSSSMRTSLREIEKDKGLVVALSLIEEEMLKANRSETRLNNEFRNHVITESLKSTHIETIDTLAKETHLPDEEELTRQEDIVMSMIDNFERDSSELRKHAEELFAGVRSLKRRIDCTGDEQAKPDHAFIEVIFNSSKLRYLKTISEIASQYNVKRSRAFSRINTYISFINRFLELSEKKMIIQGGTLSIIHNQEDFPYYYLSSGERQLIIIFAHLLFNSRLKKETVFLIDEPELSLHVAWQERLLPTILEARPDMQIVVATHAPSIIGKFDDACRSLF